MAGGFDQETEALSFILRREASNFHQEWVQRRRQFQAEVAQQRRQREARQRRQRETEWAQQRWQRIQAALQRDEAAERAQQRQLHEAERAQQRQRHEAERAQQRRQHEAEWAELHRRHEAEWAQQRRQHDAWVRRMLQQDEAEGAQQRETMGLSEEVISRYLKTRNPDEVRATDDDDDGDPKICTVCQDNLCQKYEKISQMIAILDCGHEYRSCYLKQWLQQKNVCPLCKRIAIAVRR